MSVQSYPKSFNDILKSPDHLKQFRVFLRGQLALENLLFFECIEIYEEEEEEEVLKNAGTFMVNQFVKTDSEDTTNISYILRESLEAVEEFKKYTFAGAKVEMYRLIEANFLASFIRYLKGDEDILTEFSPLLSKSYFMDLSYDSLKDVLEKNKSGELSFINCDCTEKPEGKAFCCELGRKKMKLYKILARIKPSFGKKKKKDIKKKKKNSKGSFQFSSFSKRFSSFSMSSAFSSAKVKSKKYYQPNSAKEYPCFIKKKFKNL